MKDVDKFNNLFFGVHRQLVNRMDHMFRLMTENAYEAVADAGINPKRLRGNKSAVFTASCFSESEKAIFFEKLKVQISYC